MVKGEDGWCEVFEFLEEGVLLLDQEGRISRCNPAFASYVGKDRGTIAGRTCPELGSGWASLEQVISRGHGAPSHRRTLELELAGRPFRIQAVPLTSPDKARAHFLCLLTHLGPPIRLQEELRKWLEHAGEAVVVIQEGRLRFANPPALEATGYREEEVLYRPFTDFLHPEDRGKAADAYRRRLQGEKIPPYPLRLVRKDGSLLWVQTRGAVISWKERPATLNFLLDITALRRSQEELERTAEALRESQQRLEALVETAPSLIVLTDPEGRIVLFNRACEELSGYRSEEVVGKTIPEVFLPPQWVPAVQERFADPFNPLLRLPHRNPWITKGGQERLIEWRCAPLFFPGHSRPGILGTGIDISEQQQLETELRHRTQIQDAIVALLRLSLEDLGEEELWGRVLDLLFSLPWLSLESRGCLFVAQGQTLVMAAQRNLSPAIQRSCARVPFGRCLCGRAASTRQVQFSSNLDQRHEVRYEGIHPHGHYCVPVVSGERLWGVLNLYLPAGHPRRSTEEDFLRAVTHLLAGIWERLQAQSQVRLSQARYQALVEQSPDAIYLVDPRSKRLLEANPAFCRMTGYSLEEVTSLTVHDLIAAEREDIDERFAAVLSGRILSPYERTYRRKDGSLFPVEVSARLISYADQELVSALVRDLSQKKALESQLLRAQRMESIGLLAGGIAHDLNNILSPILMNAELLQQELPESHLLHSILASAQRGAEIVRQILTFARGMEEKKDLLSPLPLLKELARFLQETFPPSIRIRTEVEKDLWYLSANPTQLHQLLLNLCLNAKEAMEKGGELILRAENRELDPAFCAMEPEARPGPYLLLQVTDTGSGIPEEHLSRICDPFFTTKEKGTGLGLFTVSTIVRAHGGFYKVRSQVQKGTEFSVFLPALPGGRKAPCPEEEGPLPAGQGELILLAEDEASVREIVQAALEGYGYQVVAAPEGASALSLYALHRDKVRLLLTDLIMPALEGSHLIRALRQLDPTLPVMVMTGAEMEERKRELDQLGIQALLPKPFTVERLLREVSRVLSGKDPAPGPGGG
jgi:PAS domain S-box-containing protein